MTKKKEDLAEADQPTDSTQLSPQQEIERATDRANPTVTPPAQKPKKKKSEQATTMPETSTLAPAQKSKRATKPTESVNPPPAGSKQAIDIAKPTDTPPADLEARTTTKSKKSSLPKLGASDNPTESNPTFEAPDLAQALVVLNAAIVSDMEHLRISTNLRLRQFEKLGLKDELEVVQVISDQIETVEKNAIKNLEKAMKAHPLGPWAKRTIGIGNKQLGRLLASIGDPGARDTVGQLWAYCGFDVREGKAPRRKRGVQGNWNEEARSRARLIAESCMKNRQSPYRKVYDDGREKYDNAVDAEGKPLSDGHKHNRALRLVAKAMLKDLWKESRERAGQDTTELRKEHEESTRPHEEDGGIQNRKSA